MPKTKNALIRQRVIDNCLSSHKNYSIKDIMTACNKELEQYGEHPVTAMNTIREDLNQISSNYPDAVIVSTRVGRNIYYSYENKSYSIFQIPFNDNEFAQLTQTLSILSKFEGMPQFEWLDEFMMRYKGTFKLEENSERFVGFDENLDLMGREHFSSLFMAINKHQVLGLQYKNFKKQTVQVLTVHPYYLKEYNKRWFLVGYTEEYQKLSIYAFDRIQSISPINARYIVNNNYDFEEYFDDMIGVTRKEEDKPIPIELKISSERWPYIATKPLHGTQKVISHTGDETIIEINVIPNKELEQLLLSYADDIEVLSPVSLRKQIKEKLTNAAKMYE